MQKLSFGILTVVAAVLVLNFQNCGGGMAPLNSSIELQSISDIDSAKVPQLLQSENLFYKSNGGTVTINKNPVFSEKSAFVVTFDRSLRTEVFRVGGSSLSDQSRVTVEPNGAIRIWHISDANAFTYAEVPMPAEGNQVTAAASFGTSPTDMILLLNGMKQKLNFVKVGSPYDFSYVQKTVGVAATGVAGVMAYSARLTGMELNVVSRYLARELNLTNVAYDPSLVSDDSGEGSIVESAEFKVAKSIIDGQCLSCHNSSNYGDYRNLTQSQFLAKGLVIAGSPEASKLYYRLSSATAGPGPRNMPQGGGISAADAEAIAAWIRTIK